MSIQNAFPGVVLPSLTPATSSRHRPRRLMVRAKVEPSDNSVEVMRKFSEQYAYHSGTSFCVDKGVVIKVHLSCSTFLPKLVKVGPYLIRIKAAIINSTM
ncbi:hypothetical protein MUK42_34425 [Musa troglodytarum]|uniref:Ferredoxin-thioredoxin reductase catalytic chain, chloroplastic n=1 Tax=Musa troglodytarum TaxID=320322 RepID=A0A9E7HJ48_9LILI|nr:hypothetical protein MUK42_34425 [Musa troglodytarum]